MEVALFGCFWMKLLFPHSLAWKSRCRVRLSTDWPFDSLEVTFLSQLGFRSLTLATTPPGISCPLSLSPALPKPSSAAPLGVHPQATVPAGRGFLSVPIMPGSRPDRGDRSW